jgi:hypothetical protein
MPPIKSSNPDSNVPSMPSRRQFLTLGIGAGFAASATAGFADFFNGGLTVFFNSKSFGTGKERAMVLFGCGKYWVAWMPGYFHAVKSNVTNLDLPDVYTGTSAGSIINSVLSEGI